MKKIKAVIFDMDGVLVEAKDWHYEALNKSLGLFGMEISRYDHLVTYDGLPTRKKLEMLTQERGLPVELHDFIYEMKQKYTMETVHSKCKPVFFHQYALSKLKKDGYKLAACSNAIRNSVETMLTKAELMSYMEFFISNQDVKKPKPDPEMYITAMDKLGLNPEECVIVEDNEKGFKAAIDSGAYLMKVKNIDDVNYQNIMGFIDKLESDKDD
jgi:beta-phosphoglucomutase-like phosphatase (HAD superfamily)